MNCFLSPLSLCTRVNQYQLSKSLFLGNQLCKYSCCTVKKKYPVDLPISHSSKLFASVNISLVWEQLEKGAVVFDFPKYSYFRISGDDRLSFLHNMSSNHFLNSQPFESRWTCFLTSTGRILDVALVLVLKDSILVVSSIEKKQMLWEHFDKHIFPMDNVSVTEENYASFVWIGKQAVDWIQNWYQQLGMNGDQEQFQVFDHTNHPIYLLQQSTLEPKWKGYLLLCSAEDIHKVHASMSSFQKKGFLLFHMDKEHWECLRIEMGKGNVLCEWSEQYHPLEAGLWHMVSFQKGCYLGQETILRLKTYGGVKRYLVGWFLEYPVETPSHVYCQKRRVGNITSCKTIQKTTTRESQPQDMTVVIGLGYLQSEYATLEYEMDKPLERIASIQDLPWESTIFFSKVPGQTSTPVKCIVRRIVFPVWH